MRAAEKNSIRKSILGARALLSAEKVSEKSSLIIDKLCERDEFKKSRLIMCYMDFRNEVMTGEFIKNCIEAGKKVSIPLVTANSAGKKEIVAALVEDIKNDCAVGTYGIMEPKKDKMRIVPPDEIDLIIVPGVAFDLNKNRIGYGAGYYDRFLRQAGDECVKIGIAFEVQIVDYIPSDEYDVTLDLLLTERRVI